MGLLVTINILCSLFLLCNSEPASKHFSFAENDRALRRLTKPLRKCYKQFKAPETHFLIANPASNASTFPVCLCETWYPSPPDHFLLTIGTIEDDAASADSSSSCIELVPVTCGSFEENEECSASLWIGEAKNNPNTNEYKNHVLLKCDKDLGSDASEPTHPIKVYKIDSFDIGKRCNGEEIVSHLNQKYTLPATLHKMPVGCARQFTPQQESPVYKPQGPVRLRTPPVPCYELGGIPYLIYTLQGAPHIPTADKPICVCEVQDAQFPNMLIAKEKSSCPSWGVTTCNEDKCYHRFDIWQADLKLLWGFVCPGGSRFDRPIAPRVVDVSMERGPDHWVEFGNYDRFECPESNGERIEVFYELARTPTPQLYASTHNALVFAAGTVMWSLCPKIQEFNEWAESRILGKRPDL